MRHLPAFLAFLFAFSIFGAAAQQSSPVAPTVPMILSTEQLRLDFKENELAAERRYGGGRQLVVFGEMRSISKQRDGTMIVIFTGVEARLRPSMAVEAATYRKGQQLQLICIFRKRDFFVSLRDCRSPNLDSAAPPEAVQSAPQLPPQPRGQASR